LRKERRRGVARELKMDPRGFRTEFEQSIQGDIVKALVELITNSDDSYKRANRNGPIRVIFEGHQRGDPRGTERVTVVDEAEGMNEREIGEGLGVVGASTSQFARHKSVRGLLGRGLKQAAFGIGVGVDVVSVKHGVISKGRLYQHKGGQLMVSKGSEYEKDFGGPDASPHPVTEAERKCYGLDADGSRIGLMVSPEKWKKHRQPVKIKEQLQRHYGLRMILAEKSTRPVHLQTKRGSEEGPLEYQYPRREPKEALVDKTVGIPGFPDAQAQITVYRAAIELGDVGEYSERGLLVVTEGVPIHNTLFGFERERYAKRLFGHIACDHIARILRQEDAEGSIRLLDLKREGLTPRHPFTIALDKVVGPILREIIEEEEKREAQRSRAPDAKLEKALRSLIPDLNELLAKLLEAVEDIPGGGGGGGRGKRPKPPPPPPPQPDQALEFHPDEIGVRAHAERGTTLYVRDGSFTDGARIRVAVEGGGTKVLTRELRVDHARGAKQVKNTPEGYSCLGFRVEGTQAGTNSLVTASLAGESAMLLVTVGAETAPPPPRPPRGGGFLRDIKPVEDQHGRWRADYSRTTGVLKINRLHPVLALYDPGEHAGTDGSARRAWVGAMAEALCDALFRQVISEYIEVRGRIPRSNGWDPTMTELDSLWYEHAAAIHKLVEARLSEADGE
jgi:hypothetical protein